jgi:pimeloyl-ACP methyl ester carboxylesterase
MNKRSLLRVLRIGVTVASLLILVIYLGLPTLMALAAIRPDSHQTDDAPQGFASVRMTAEDGIQLGAWYSPPTNGVAVVLVHGAGSGRSSVSAYAAMLQEHGYGVLAVSARGFDDSEGNLNRLGWAGSRDIGAAAAFLQEQADVRTIGGLGLSMGGEILLGAASAYPEIRLIIADGATHRSVQDYVDLPMNGPLYRNFTQRVFTFMVSLFSGEQPPAPTLLESIQAAGTTQFMFIAAGNDEDEVAFNTLFHDAAPELSSLWVVPQVEHTGGFAAYPAEYEQRVISFLEAAETVR